jgi:hypothetical protein
MRTDLHRVADVEPIEPVEHKQPWLWVVYLLTLVLAVVASAFYPDHWFTP